jgi:hypothetical protein
MHNSGVDQFSDLPDGFSSDHRELRTVRDGIVSIASDLAILDGAASYWIETTPSVGGIPDLTTRTSSLDQETS